MTRGNRDGVGRQGLIRADINQKNNQFKDNTNENQQLRHRYGSRHCLRSVSWSYQRKHSGWVPGKIIRQQLERIRCLCRHESRSCQLAGLSRQISSIRVDLQSASVVNGYKWGSRSHQGRSTTTVGAAHLLDQAEHLGPVFDYACV